MKLDRRPGNRIDLLENGERFYPAVFWEIEHARDFVLIETFILFDDPVGRQLQSVLIDAARRGVRVDVTVDGWGSPDLGPDFIAALTSVGARVHVFDPAPRWLGFRSNPLRRMHRKIVVVDGRMAFVGGINYSSDHLMSFGARAKQDYAVRIEGPLVADIERLARSSLASRPRRRWRPRALPRRGPVGAPPDGGPWAALVTRDNQRHRKDIELCYRAAIRAARKEIILANAYFFPGYHLMRELRRAARRGVAVRLILQGEPDMAIVRVAEHLLQHALVKDGVEIHKYCRRPLHGKVAVIDGAWATVGSSNLDPMSLALNLEANVVMHDVVFAAHLRDRLLDLMRNDCELVASDEGPTFWPWRYVISALAYHLMRRFPLWLRALPEHRPHIETFEPGSRPKLRAIAE